MVNYRKSWNAGRAILAAGLMALGCPASLAQTVETKPSTTQVVPFDTDHWVLEPGSEIVSFGGRTAFAGTGYVKGVMLLNGTIEADIWVAEAISFAGFMFHGQSFEQLEWIWFRAHKTNGLASDGIQYAPAYRGISCWQLYPQYNAKVAIPKNEWVHLKLKILNGTAIFYVKDMQKPVMTIDHLQHGNKKGLIGLKALQTDTVYFSNFTYRIDETSEVVALPQEIVAPNVVTAWRLSPSYPIASVDAVPTTYPAQQIADIESWITPDVAASGLVNISKYHGLKQHARNQAEGGRPLVAILRTFIEAKEVKRVKMNFGYSDAVTIFLNGVPLFSGNSAFLSRNESYSGWISFNDAVFLNLKKGRNELVAVVAEDFGGWGFQAKLDDVNGIHVHSNPKGEQSSVSHRNGPYSVHAPGVRPEMPQSAPRVAGRSVYR